jgi:choline dehydrogenase
MGKLIPDPKMTWSYATQPEPALGGRRVGWPRGRVLGGSGSINGLVFLRGAASDYDAWERLGARGWSHKDVLAYFKRLEHNARGPDAWRGSGGPMHISDITAPSPAARAFVEACEGLQYRRNGDFNGERIDGVGYVQLNVRKGWRWSTAAGYLKPNLSRRNLELMTNAMVRRVIVEQGRAVGVEVELADGTRRQIGARRRLVLSGGTINSPVLLLASGIGPAAELARADVGVVHDLPGIGKNLQDHVLARSVFRTDHPGTLNEVTRSPLQSMRMGLQWLVNGSGPLAVSAVEATLFAKSRPSEPEVDLQFQGLNFSSDSLKEGLNLFPGFTFIYGVCRPKSRGEIRLADAEGRKAPRI